MKTIEEGTKRYIGKSLDQARSENDFENISRIFVFEAGIEFAQRWISVDEELPEGVYYEGIWSERVLVLDDYNRVHTAIYDHEYGVWRFNENNLSHLKVTHWRPIELK